MLNMGVTSPNIYHIMLTAGYKTVTPDEELTNESKFIKAFIEKNDIKVILIDSLIDIFQGSENDAVHAAKNFDFLRQIFPDTLVILLHHESKPNEQFATKKSPGNRMRGSTNVFNELSGQIAISVPNFNQPANLIVEHGKMRRGKKLNAFEIKMDIVDDVFHQGETKVVGFTYIKEVIFAEMALDEAREAILEFLGDHNDWVSGPELKDALKERGVGKTALEDALKQLREEDVDVSSERRGKAFYYKLYTSGVYQNVEKFIGKL